MNTNNSNQKLGFDKFAESNYTLHWSFSNFNRVLMAANLISQLRYDAMVLELGAGTSDLERMVHENFNRDDIHFVKVDGDPKYNDRSDIIVADITKIPRTYIAGEFDCVVLMEVIEHINKSDAISLMEKIYEWTRSGGMLILTTPTPPFDGRFEDRVWPDDHEEEFCLYEIKSLMNEFFKIEKEIGWSLEKRDYQMILETEPNIAVIVNRLRGAFPESFIRAITSSLVDSFYSRQVLLVGEKRRVANGRSSSSF